jgi:hypothetical protein
VRTLYPIRHLTRANCIIIFTRLTIRFRKASRSWVPVAARAQNRACNLPPQRYLKQLGTITLGARREQAQKASSTDRIATIAYDV